jgi:DNA-binding XRE family transcriptional regulator
MQNGSQQSRRGNPRLGIRLQTARRLAGYRSAREACVSHGWSEPRYRAHEAGTRRPGPDSLAAYAAAFQVGQGWLATGDGEGPEVDYMPIEQRELRTLLKLRAPRSGPPDISRRLRLARRLAGYRSASAAATAHGWNRSSYHAHETGQSGLSWEACQAYAEAFGIRADWLLKGGLPTGWPSAIEAKLPDLLALYDTPEALAQEQLPQGLDLPRSPKTSPVSHGLVKLRRKVNVPDDTAPYGMTAPPEPENSASIGEYELGALRAMGARASGLRCWRPSRHFTFPRSYIKDVLGADPDHTIMVIATHDEPRLALRKGDRLIIDTASQAVSTGDLFVAVAHGEPRLVVFDRTDLDEVTDPFFDLGHAAAAHIGPLIGRYCGRLHAI